jgi:hypothetical protein
MPIPDTTTPDATPAPATPKRLADCKPDDFYFDCTAWAAAEEVGNDFENAASRIAAHLDEAAIAEVADRLRSDIEGSIGGAVERALDELIALEEDHAS